MKPSEFFQHCPRCGSPAAAPLERAPFDCAVCGFRYFFNPSVAVAVYIVRDDGQVLFIRRAREPAKDKLAPPGGFIDIGETAEEAARREVREEVGLGLGALTFLSSHPNAYHYREVTYPVLDLFFTARAVGAIEADSGEVAGLAWFDPAAVPLAEIAFPSMRAAWERWRTVVDSK